MRRIHYMVVKEFRQVFRDRPMLAIIFMVPLIQLLILANAITTDVKHIKLAVADFDRSQVSREIVRSFTQTQSFDLVGYLDNMGQIGDEMRAWNVQVALVIPKNFNKDLHRGSKPQIFIAADGVDGNTAGIALGYASSILSNLGVDLLPLPQKMAAFKSVHLLSMAERMWYNIELNSKQFMVPGIVVVLLTIIPMMLSAMGLVKEKEIGTLEQLMVTPMRKHQLLLGKIIPILVLSFVELIIVMGFAIMVFGLTMSGSFGLLGFLSFLYLFTTIGFGIFVSTFTSSQQQAMFFSWFIMVFMILMSGFFIPIENMPDILRKLTYLNPMRYFMYIIRDIFQKGASLVYLWEDVLPMTVFGLIIFTMGVVKFRKRVG